MQRFIITFTLIALVAGTAGSPKTVMGADNDMPAVIPMKNPAYASHEKGIVQFKHNAHTAAFPEKYPEIFADGCGECHHDDLGEPLTDLKPGDSVDLCIDCHYEPGRMPISEKREMRSQNASRDDIKARELEYHAEAVHDLCRGCHRDVRRKTNTKQAPTTCLGCHPREK